MTFSAEDSFLLATLRTVTRDDRLPALPPVDWGTILLRAQAHKITPILAHALRHHPDRAYIPTTILTEIATITRDRRIRNSVMTDDFLTVLRRLNEAGIASIALKGVALANTVYPNVALRYFDDLDLLVKPDSADAALAVLRQLGYAPHPRAHSGDWHHRIPYTHPQRGTTVEIHTDVVRRFRAGWPSADLWSRAQLVTIEGEVVRTLGTEDALIHTALHARHTRFGRITTLIDSALLLRQSFDPSLLQQLSVIAGATTALSVLFDLIITLQLAETVPSIPHSRMRRRMAHTIVGLHDLQPRSAMRQIGPWPKLFELFLVDFWGDSFALGRKLIAPPEAFLNAAPQYEPERRATRVRRLVLRSKIALKHAFTASVSRLRK